MFTTFPKEIGVEKLEQVASGWVEEYGGYIAEISFFCSKETSVLNIKEYQYCIDFVLCDPPHIEPVSRFSSGFIAKESGVMSVRLLGLMPEQTDSELIDEMRSNRFDSVITPRQKKENEFLSQWRIDIRWETDQPDPSYIPESKQVLYLRPKGQPTKGIAKLLPEDYERLRHLPFLRTDECLSLMLEMPYEQTIIAIQKGELDIQVAATVQKKISELLLLLSRSFYAGELQDYRGLTETDDPAFKTENFFEWAKKKGYNIPVAQDDTKNELNEKNTIQISNDSELKWKDITVTFISDTEIHVQYKDLSVTRTYEMAGFLNKKNKLPIKAWVTLRDSSKDGGRIPFDFRSRKTVEKRAQDIRKKIRGFFPNIEGDPIPLNNNFYQTDFHLRTTIE